MAAENTFHFPKPGQRIVRSVIAVARFCVFYLRNREGIPFYSALAVLQCIQPYQDSMAQVAKKRVTGTFVGAFWGLVIILIQMYLFHGSLMDTFPGYMLISLFTGIVIYSTVVLNCKNTAYFSCVVFLSITVMHMTDESPFLFVFNRVLDTLIGVEIALIVNTVHLPRKRQKDILFVSGIDDTLLNQKDQMSTSQAQTICDFLDRKGTSYFTNCVVDDLLVIYYDQLISPLHQEVYERRHRSPHRNYVQKTQSVYENVVYLYLLDKKEIMEKLAFTKTPQPIMARCFIQKDKKLVDGKRYLILDYLQDPGNIGTLIRTALAFGIDQVILSNECVDLYNDKLLRSMQGAHFHLSCLYGDLKKLFLL